MVVLVTIAYLATLAQAFADEGEPDFLHRDPCDDNMAPDLGWLQSYLQIGFFSDFRNQAWRFYLRNETTYAFLWLNSIAYANLEFVREACLEAARLVLLLRAEERLPVREAGPALLELASLEEQARGQAIDLPLMGQRANWPSRVGIQRLQQLTARMEQPEEPSVDVVMPYCDEPLDGLLSRTTGYDDEWLSARVPLRHLGLVLYRLQVCAPGVGHLQGAAALASLPARAAEAARHFRSVEVVPVDASPSAWEAARYLIHLADRYDRLADFTLFLHPDVFEHVNPRTLRNVLQSLRVGSFQQSGLGPNPDGQDGDKWFEYVSLSHHYLMQPSRIAAPSSNCTDAALSFEDLRRRVFDEEYVEGQAAFGKFGFYCCSQFMVHRKRVQRRSKDWYRRVAETIPWEHCATSYMELLWHGIFHAGSLHEAKRQERTDLPLFLRVDNFIETTSDGLV